MKSINYLLDRLSDLNTKKKLLLSYIIIVFIPVLGVGIILTTGMRNITLNQAVNEASVNVDRLEKSITDILKSPIDFSNILILDKSLKKLISSQYNSTIDVVEAYWQYSKFDEYVRLYSSIDSIMLYSVNDTLIENWRFMKTSKEISESAWYKNAINKRGKISWQYIYNPYIKKYNLSMTRMLKTENNPLGVLVINMNSYYLNSIIKKEPFETFVVDEKGYVITAKNLSFIGQTIDKLNLGQDIIKKDQGIFETEFQNEISKVIVKPFYPEGSASKLKIFCIFPIDNIVSGAKRISFVGYSIITVSLLVTLIFITLFADVLSKRIKHLSGDVHEVALGNFRSLSIIKGNDEVGQLSKDLNMMAISIERLLYEVNETSLQKNQLIIKQKEIKLKMLANQINPHFLFNALESIRMKIHDIGETETADVVALLGKIMRRNLEISNELTTISEEIDIVKSYLDIQKFRYEDKINYYIDIEDDIGNYGIMPLIIQPIVENSVVHGLENMDGNGVIIVDIKRINGFLKISVIDNGLGIDGTKLDYIQKSLNETENDSSKRIGLKNVHQRIKLYYGDDYGLKVSSEPDHGTRIDILLPELG